MPIYWNGLLLGFSLIMALGPQNIFLIRQGTKRQHAILSAGICFCCDIILVCSSITGLHSLLTLHPALQNWIIWFGVAFLAYYGIAALKKAFLGTSSKAVQKDSGNRVQIILLALGFSLLNPHAIIDSIVIIGGGSAQFPEHQGLFLMGVLTSSLLWFSSLTFTTYYFAPILARAKIWRNIELFSGFLMLFLSFKLASTQF